MSAVRACVSPCSGLHFAFVMRPLYHADGITLLEDSKGQQIKVGTTVVHEFLGEAIARDTVPLDQVLRIDRKVWGRGT